MPRGAKPGERRGGRKKGTPNKVTADVRAACLLHSTAAIETLVRICSDTAAPAQAQVQAAKELLDRAYGKSPQPIKHGGDEKSPPIGLNLSGKVDHEHDVAHRLQPYADIFRIFTERAGTLRPDGTAQPVDSPSATPQAGSIPPPR
jgi:hypothetical protein